MMTIASVCDGVQECKNNSDEEFCSQDSLTTVILGKSTFVCLLVAKYQKALKVQYGLNENSRGYHLLPF